MRKKIIVNGIEFKSQRVLKKYAQDCIGRMNIGAPVGQGSDFEFIKALIVERHPNDGIKAIARESDAFLIETHMNGNHVVPMKNGSALRLEPLSWNKAVVAREDSENVKKSEKLRRLIVDQVLEFRDSTEKICNICSVELAKGKYHVDHVKPFSMLVKEFNTSGEKSFTKFHKENATLQLLCIRCNVEKGSKYQVDSSILKLFDN